jgi:hypothetical protein
MSTGLFLVRRAEDLHHALDLAFPSDDGVELAFDGQLGQVAAEGVQGRRLRFLARAGLGAGLALVAQETDDFGLNAVEVDLHVLEDLGGDAFALFHQAEEDVLGSDVAVVEAARLFDRQFKDLLRPGGEGDLVAGHHGVAALDLLFDLGGQGFDVDAEVFKGTGGDAVRFAAQAEENVLGPHVFAAEARRFLAGGAHDMLCSFGKSFPHFLVALFIALRGYASATL